MLRRHAKKLKPGDEVFWIKSQEKRTKGTVIRKHYNTVWINWEDVGEQKHFAEAMDYVYTQAQLDRFAKDEELVAKVKKINAERLKLPARHWGY